MEKKEKQKKYNLNSQQEQKKIFKKILENISKNGPEKEINSNRNSFSFLSSFTNNRPYKNKFKINKKNTTDFEIFFEKRNSLFLSSKYSKKNKRLKFYNNYSEIRTKTSNNSQRRIENYSFDYKIKQNNLNKKNDLTSSGLKTSFSRNFILKSEIKSKLSNKDNSNINFLTEEENYKNIVDFIFTQKRRKRKQNQIKNNQFYNYFYNKY